MLITQNQNNSNVHIPKDHERLTGNHLTTKGRLTCRFELFVRWPESSRRKMNPFKYRGDRLGLMEADKMIAWLVKFFIKDHHDWLLAELWDNTKQLNDPERIVLSWKRGIIDTNRLKDYEPMLQTVAIPDWMK